MALALSTDPLDEGADKGFRWIDRVLAAVAVICMIGLLAYAATRLF